MTYRVEIAPPARDEFDETFAWIFNNSPAAAVRWRDGLFEALHSLREWPRRCPLAPENDVFDEDIRQLLYGKKLHAFRILFTVDEQVVQILHIRHGARKHMEGEQPDSSDE